MERLVVVGNGMADVACVEQILRHSPKFEITIFGDETHVNYNRIPLSSVLAYEKSDDDIVLNGLDWYQCNNIDLRLGVRIVGVDSQAKTVTGDDGSVTRFDKLLLATGSVLHRQYIHRSRGGDVRCSGLNPQSALLESASGHCSQPPLRSALHRSRVVCD